MEDSEDYSLNVHKSLMERKGLFGIGAKAFWCIFIVTVVFMSLTSVAAITFGIIAILVCRFICRDEPLLVDFILDFLKQKSLYNG